MSYATAIRSNQPDSEKVRERGMWEAGDCQKELSPKYTMRWKKQGEEEECACCICARRGKNMIYSFFVIRIFSLLERYKK